MLFLPALLFLGALPLADVVIDGDVALLLATDDHRQPEHLDVHQGTVFAHAEGRGIDAPALQCIAGIAEGFGAERLGPSDQIIEILPDGFVGGVAKKLLRRRVPGHDVGVQVDGHHGHRTVADEGLEVVVRPRPTFLAAPSLRRLLQTPQFPAQRLQFLHQLGLRLAIVRQHH